MLSATRCTRSPLLHSLRAALLICVPRTFLETITSVGSDKLNNSYGNSRVDWVPGTRETTKIEIMITAARVAEEGLPPYRSYENWLY